MTRTLSTCIFVTQLKILTELSFVVLAMVPKRYCKRIFAERDGKSFLSVNSREGGVCCLLGALRHWSFCSIPIYLYWGAQTGTSASCVMPLTCRDSVLYTPRSAVVISFLGDTCFGGPLLCPQKPILTELWGQVKGHLGKSAVSLMPLACMREESIQHTPEPAAVIFPPRALSWGHLLGDGECNSTPQSNPHKTLWPDRGKEAGDSLQVWHP